jgi:hypothetical protein
MYEGFTKKVLEIISKISIHHFTPPQSLLLYAQVIETCTFFLTTPSFPSNLQKFSSAMTSSPSPIPGFKGIQFGEVVEKLKKEDGKEEGSACKLFIGWETVEDHMKFRETELFKENVPLLRTANEGVEMVSFFLSRGEGSVRANEVCSFMLLLRIVCERFGSVRWRSKFETLSKSTFCRRGEQNIKKDNCTIRLVL